MKKTLTVLLAVMMMLGFASCLDNVDSGEDPWIQPVPDTIDGLDFLAL